MEDPSKARIYVFRPTTFAFAITMKITDGETLVGNTGPKGYLCWESEPGEMELVGKAENTATLPLQVEMGVAYYIKQNVQMGILFARNKLIQLNESEGKEAVKKCKPPKLGQ